MLTAVHVLDCLSAAGNKTKLPPAFEEEDSGDCEVCCNLPATVVFEPCSHCFVCEDCCIKMKKCLKCKVLITAKKRQGGSGLLLLHCSFSLCAGLFEYLHTCMVAHVEACTSKYVTWCVTPSQPVHTHTHTLLRSVSQYTHTQMHTCTYFHNVKKCHMHMLSFSVSVLLRPSADGSLVGSSTNVHTLDLKRRLQEMEDSLLCAVCMERKKDTVFMCGHAVCSKCSDALQMCPMCRKAITRRISLYT